MMNAIKGALARHPVLFNSLVGYSVFASGDVMAQRLDLTSEAEGGASAEWEWDHRRSLSIGLLGIVQNGFLLRIWYRTLDKFVTPKVRYFVVLLQRMAGRSALFLANRCRARCDGKWSTVHIISSC